MEYEFLHRPMTPPRFGEGAQRFPNKKLQLPLQFFIIIFFP